MATTLPPTAKPETVHTEAERLALQQQLERILSSQHFSGSKRYPSFLRFVMNHALE